MLPPDPRRTRFDYAVAPSNIAYSGGDGDSIVNLRITATNNTGEAMACPRIVVVVPAGKGSDSLTEDPRLITGAPGGRTPWAIGIGGEQTWTATPLPPTTGLAAGQGIEIVLANVVVNRVHGDADLTIDELTDVVRSTKVTVCKTHPSEGGGEQPKIVQFLAAPDEVALGGNTTLSWLVANATSGAIEPDGIVLDQKGIADGSVTLPVTESITFTLRAIGPGGSSQAPAAVAVMPVEIVSFSAEPQTVKPNEPVVLDWATRFAVECAIDQGIGPVPRQGSRQVKVSRTTIFTLRADGLNPQTRAVTVKVLPHHPPQTKDAP